MKEFQPLYLVLHVNHPREITPEFKHAVTLLADAGIPLISQTVLLRGINDRSQILQELFSNFVSPKNPSISITSLSDRSRDRTFPTSISHGLKLAESLRGKMTGLSLPRICRRYFRRKIPLKYETILSRNKKTPLLKNHEGKIFVYSENIFSSPLTMNFFVSIIDGNKTEM